MNDEIKVSVIMLTYNHENFIKEAVESVLGQKTDFCYEVLVSDDASTDRTQEVLRQHFRQINQIKLLLRKKNVGGTRNMYSCLKRIRGKYFILLEGDDYWENENMLQSQVDFLEENQNYVGVGGKLKVVDERGRYIKNIMPQKYYNREFSLGNYLNGETLHFRAVLWKNRTEDFGEELKLLYRGNPLLGDFTLNLLFLEKGEVFLRDIAVADYRGVQKKGSTSYNSLRSSYGKYEDHMKIIQLLERKHTPVHDYTVLYDVGTVLFVKLCMARQSYGEILLAVRLLGVFRFMHAMKNYQKYADRMI